MSYDGSDLAILVPLWQRLENIPRLLVSIAEATPAAQVVWIANVDDHACASFAESRMRYSHEPGELSVVVPWAGGTRGDYARKINAGYRASTAPFMFTAADDVVFHPDWYARARPLIDELRMATTVLSGGATLTGPGPIPRIGVVGTNDGSNPRTFAGAHSTHSLVARWYADQGCSADQGGMIYHEGYWHEYCDDELVQTAKARDAYAHAGDAIVEHHHPVVGPHAGVVPDDDVYRHGRAHTQESRRLFRSRAWLWRGNAAGTFGERT